MFVHSKKTNCFYSFVYGVGSQTDLENFRFRIKFYGPKAEALYVGPVVSSDKPFREVIKDDDGLVMRDGFIKRIRNGKDVKYEVEVFELP
jgi:hypothetical protein